MPLKVEKRSTLRIGEAVYSLGPSDVRDDTFYDRQVRVTLHVTCVACRRTDHLTLCLTKAGEVVGKRHPQLRSKRVFTWAAKRVREILAARAN